MEKSKFSGMGVALITPFLKDGNIDFEALETLVEFQISNGTDYLVVMGTTGEVPTLSKDEKFAVINHVLKVNAKRVPIVVGFGGNNTNEVIQQINEFENSAEIDAILSVAPYYNKPTQNGLFQHYKAIAAISKVPLILYNVPGRTNVNLEAETTLKIASEIENIIGIKEASGNMDQIMTLLKNKPKEFMIISGDDALTLPLILLGAQGVISVLGNAFPKQWSTMVNLALNGKNKEALEIHFQFLDIIKNIFIEGNPAGVKAIMDFKNLCHNYLRLPLTPVSKTHLSKLIKLTEEIK